MQIASRYRRFSLNYRLGGCFIDLAAIEPQDWRTPGFPLTASVIPVIISPSPLPELLNYPLWDHRYDQMTLPIFQNPANLSSQASVIYWPDSASGFGLRVITKCCNHLLRLINPRSMVLIIANLRNMAPDLDTELWRPIASF